jgi:predicted transposase YdaD
MITLDIRKTRAGRELMAEGWAEGWIKGWIEGWAEGRAEVKKEMLLRFLARHLGVLPATMLKQLGKLEPSQIDELTDCFLDMADPKDLRQWLRKQKAR